MTLAILAGVAGALVAVAAAACLWRASIRCEPSVRNAYRWLAVVAVLWGAGFVAEEAMAASGTGTSLTYADLLTLLALPTLGAGLFGLARARRERERDDRRAARAQVRGAVARLADGCLLATSLFVIGWVAVFGSEYRRTDESAGAFALQAIHPIADLIALGVLLALAVRARRLGLAPYLALLAVTVGDSLAVTSRISGGRPGVWALLVQLAGFCLLAAASLPVTGLPRAQTASAVTGPPRAQTSSAVTGLPRAQTSSAVTGLPRAQTSSAGRPRQPSPARPARRPRQPSPACPARRPRQPSPARPARRPRQPSPACPARRPRQPRRTCLGRRAREAGPAGRRRTGCRPPRWSRRWRRLSPRPWPSAGRWGADPSPSPRWW
jgi:hypothetical protein